MKVLILFILMLLVACTDTNPELHPVLVAVPSSWSDQGLSEDATSSPDSGSKGFPSRDALIEAGADTLVEEDVPVEEADALVEEADALIEAGTDVLDEEVALPPEDAVVPVEDIAVQPKDAGPPPPDAAPDSGGGCLVTGCLGTPLTPLCLPTGECVQCANDTHCALWEYHCVNYECVP